VSEANMIGAYKFKNKYKSLQ